MDERRTMMGIQMCISWNTALLLRLESSTIDLMID